MANLAPLVIFAFNRPNHLAQVIDSLTVNELAKETDVIFFCDGARNQEDVEKISAIKTYLEKISVSGFFKSVKVTQK